MVTLHDVIEGLKEKFPGLTHNRIPVCNSASPLEADFDALCGALIGTNVNCPVIVNCQVRFLTLLKYISHNVQGWRNLMAGYGSCHTNI